MEEARAAAAAFGGRHGHTRTHDAESTGAGCPHMTASRRLGRSRLCITASALARRGHETAAPLAA